MAQSRTKDNALLVIICIISILNGYPMLVKCHVWQPCSTFQDYTYPGHQILDCSRRGLTSDDLPHLADTLNIINHDHNNNNNNNNIDNITTLILNDNDIRRLQNRSLSKFTQLKGLKCMRCELSFLEADALFGLSNLEVLLLRYNQLNIVNDVFPSGFFRHVPRLKTLVIDNNGVSGYASNYSQYLDIFDSLPSLTNLSIDSFSNLVIGEEFSKLKNLNQLEIRCNGLKEITNDSLKGFQISTVKHFALLKGLNYFDGEDCNNLFQYLPDTISSLRVSDLVFGNRKMMMLVEPLRGKQLDTIHFDNIGIYSSLGKTDKEKLRDRNINSEMMKHIKDVCVRHLIWLRSYAVSFDVETATSGVWPNCMRTLTVVIGNTGTDRKAGTISSNANLISLVRLKFLESVIFTVDSDDENTVDFWKQKYTKLENDTKVKDNPSETIIVSEDNFGTDFDMMTTETTEALVGGSKVISSTLRSTNNNSNNNNNSYKTSVALANAPNVMSPRLHPTNYNNNNNNNNNINYNNNNNNNNINNNNDNDNIIPSPYLKTHRDTIHKHQQLVSKTRRITISIPRNLTTVVFNDAHCFTTFYGTIFLSKNNVRSITLRNSDMRNDLNAPMIGFDKLESADFTNSKLGGTPNFFRWYPSARKLVMRNTRQTSEYYSRVAENILNLEYFDIANNGLSHLPSKKMFGSNKNLRFVCLASNHFIGIPFDLALTPSLEILDLRSNPLVVFTNRDLQSIDDHVAHVTSFTLLINNNQTSCGCSALPFLKWLRFTSVHLDQNGNYTCITEDSKVSYTAAFNDVASLWRSCYGQTYLLISLIFLAGLVAIYLAAFLWMKHRTWLISRVMRLVRPGFGGLETRNDFDLDVFIGYADGDGNFVKDTLLRYLENKWHLRTFVHQRDLLQDPLMMSRAIRASWRTLLVITENFLERQDFAHNIMKVCAFSVDPVSNPGKVVVLVEHSVQNRIPEYVLEIMEEDNIIRLPSLQSTWFNYETKEALKTRILQ